MAGPGLPKPTPDPDGGYATTATAKPIGRGRASPRAAIDRARDAYDRATVRVRDAAARTTAHFGLSLGHDHWAEPADVWVCLPVGVGSAVAALLSDKILRLSTHPPHATIRDDIQRILRMATGEDEDTVRAMLLDYAASFERAPACPDAGPGTPAGDPTWPELASEPALHSAVPADDAAAPTDGERLVGAAR